jgi:hypothetical protein
MSPAQAGAAQAGLRTLAAWALAASDPEEVLLSRLRRQDPAEVLVGLATVGRLLATELALATGRDEVRVLTDLDRVVQGLQVA